MNNYFIARGQKNGKDTVIRFNKNEFNKENATELLNNNDVKNFLFFFEPAQPTEIDEKTILFSGEVGFDITLDILLPYIKANKTIALNSAGGYNSEAMLIHDTIKDFYSDTKMLILGNCFSATNQIFLSAKYENRQATQHSKFLIHNGWVYMEGDHNELRTVANMLEKETETMINLYMKVSGKSRDEIVNLMEKEALLNTSEALDLKFISKIKNNESESSNNNNQTDNNMNVEQKEAVSGIENAINKFKNLFKSDEKAVKNIVLSDTNGVNLDFDAETEADIVEGTRVTANGDPASGTYEFPNFTIVAENGSVVFKTEKEAEQENSEVEQLQAEIETLKAQNETVSNKLTESETLVKNLEFEKETLTKQVEEVKNSFESVNSAYEKLKNTFSDGSPKNEKKPEEEKKEEKKKVTINKDKVRRGVTY